MQSPRWKIYDQHSEYQASCKDLTLAAGIVAILGNGATIRDGHTHVIWREGKESIPASESYDIVAHTAYARRCHNYAVEPGQAPQEGEKGK